MLKTIAFYILFSFKNGFRCYLFKCDQHCIMIKHSDYIVLRSKSPDQLDQSQEPSSSSSSVNTQQITTGHNQDSKF